MRFINNHLLKLIPLNFINCEIENSGYKKKTNIIILLNSLNNLINNIICNTKYIPLNLLYSSVISRKFYLFNKKEFFNIVKKRQQRITELIKIKIFTNLKDNLKYRILIILIRNIILFSFFPIKSIKYISIFNIKFHILVFQPLLSSPLFLKYGTRVEIVVHNREDFLDRDMHPLRFYIKCNKSIVYYTWRVIKQFCCSSFNLVKQCSIVKLLRLSYYNAIGINLFLRSIFYLSESVVINFPLECVTKASYYYYKFLSLLNWRDKKVRIYIGSENLYQLINYNHFSIVRESTIANIDNKKSLYICVENNTMLKHSSDTFNIILNSNYYRWETNEILKLNYDYLIKKKYKYKNKVKYLKKMIKNGLKFHMFIKNHFIYQLIYFFKSSMSHKLYLGKSETFLTIHIFQKQLMFIIKRIYYAITSYRNSSILVQDEYGIGIKKLLKISCYILNLPLLNITFQVFQQGNIFEQYYFQKYNFNFIMYFDSVKIQHQNKNNAIHHSISNFNDLISRILQFTSLQNKCCLVIKFHNSSKIFLDWITYFKPIFIISNRKSNNLIIKNKLIHMKNLNFLHWLVKKRHILDLLKLISITENKYIMFINQIVTKMSYELSFRYNFYDKYCLIRTIKNKVNFITYVKDFFLRYRN